MDAVETGELSRGDGRAIDVVALICGSARGCFPGLQVFRGSEPVVELQFVDAVNSVHAYVDAERAGKALGASVADEIIPDGLLDIA